MSSEKALECIKEVEKVILKYGFVFPPRKLTASGIPKPVRMPKKELDIVKRVLGILKNPTEENALQKIENVTKFLSNFVG